MFLLTSLCFSAMMLFCLAMHKHRKQVIDKKLPHLVVHCFKPLAWLLLLLAAYVSVELFGWSIGPALLFGALTVAILLLTLLLTYRAKIVLPLAFTLAAVLSLMASISLFS